MRKALKCKKFYWDTMVSYKYNTHVSLLLLQNESEELFFQRKTKDYPIKPFAGKLCLIGGNWTEIEDKNPKDTLIREVSEELVERNLYPFLEELINNLSPFSEYEITVPAELLGKNSPMIYIASVFSSKVKSSLELELTEGDIAKLTAPGLLNEEFSFAYGEIVNDFLVKDIAKSYPGPSIQRLGTKSLLLDYTDRDMSRYRVNPLRDNHNLADKLVFDVDKQ